MLLELITDYLNRILPSLIRQFLNYFSLCVERKSVIENNLQALDYQICCIYSVGTGQNMCNGNAKTI